jgi:hypothetical protein
MQKGKHINKRVEETLDSLDGIKRASPQPFFYTRVRSLLEKAEKSFWEKTGFFLARPAIAIAIVFITLLINAFFVFYQNNHVQAASDQDEFRFENAYDIASNTNNTIISIFNRENEQPGKK